jgi:hypothetical protein
MLQSLNIWEQLQQIKIHKKVNRRLNISGGCVLASTSESLSFRLLPKNIISK